MATVNGAAERLTAIDFWRGFALATIFVNHVPGNALEPFTHKNFGFSDASELFVFLAGVSVALVYLPKFMAGEGLRQSMAIWMRAFHLYTVHLLVLLVCAAIVAYTTLATGDTRIPEALNFHHLLSMPAEALVGIAALGLQPSYIDILPLYIVLLVGTPLMLAVLRVSRVAALVLSGALYAATWAFNLQFPTYPADGFWFFNPFAWQFLFVAGAVVGSMIRRGEAVPVSPWLVGLALGYLVLSATWMITGHYFEGWAAVPRMFWDLDKSNLSLPRLLHLLALVYLVSCLPLEAWLRRAAWLAPFTLLGRHALPVFAFGTVLSIAAQMLRVTLGSDIFTDFAIITAGLLLQLGLAWALEWNKAGARRSGAGSPGLVPVAARAPSPDRAG